MTQQMLNRAEFEGEEYLLLAWKGDNLPTPEDVGLKPGVWNTGCSRGYVATYGCEDDELFLSHLHIGRLSRVAGEEPEWPVINGVTAEVYYLEVWGSDGTHAAKEELRPHGKIYKDLRIPTFLTGRLLIAREFFWNLFMPVVMGPFHFQYVYDLAFHEGTLVNAVDLSEIALQWRALEVEAGNRIGGIEWRNMSLSGATLQEIFTELYPRSMDAILPQAFSEWKMDYNHWGVSF